MASRTNDYWEGLVRELCRLPAETEWLEFKHNNADPQEIGEYVSALSNSAVLAGKACGYCIWGIEDGTHKIVGTTFSPETSKKGNENLINWIGRLLSPKVDFAFHTVNIKGHRVVILEIARALQQPVSFQGVAYVRVGSYKKNLKNEVEKERLLWRAFDDEPFEEIIALSGVSEDEVLRHLDYPAYFTLLNVPLPPSKEGILEALAADRLIARSDAGTWNITNLGALLFATRLNDFPTLGRKAIRVIVYKGKGKVETVREQLGNKGYASGFEGLISFINGLLPTNEALGVALRRTVPMYPEMAVRELVA
ncbi:MAG: putative DNA binding domain-containing protein, partial [Novosphingobium sp.]|nr:putative DNA binding domain-containing protein [Novosphingobium sp.]